jgi:hypothetical protein
MLNTGCAPIEKEPFCIGLRGGSTAKHVNEKEIIAIVNSDFFIARIVRSYYESTRNCG